MTGTSLPPLELHDLLRSLAEKKRRIVVISLVTLVIALSLALWRPTQYSASVLLQVHHTQENSLGSVTGTGDPDNLINEPVSLQMSLIRSRFILGPVIQSLGLSTAHDKKIRIRSLSPARLPESELVEKLRARLIVKDMTGLSENFPNKPTVLQLSLTGSDPKEIVQLVNTIAKMTQRKDAERKTIAAKKTLDFLNHQLRVVQAELKQSEASLNQYRLASSRIDTKLQTQHLLSRLSDIDQKLEASRLKQLDLSQQYTALHPFVIAVNQQQAALQKQREALFVQIRKMTEADEVADDLAREVTAKNNLYMTLLNRIHTQQVVAAGIVSDVGILSLATYAETLLPRHLTTIGIMALIAGLLLGSFSVLLAKLFHQIRASD